MKTILKEFKEKKKSDTNIFKSIADETDKKQFQDKNVEMSSLIDKMNRDYKNSANYREIAKYIRLFPDSTSELKPSIISGRDSVALKLLAILSEIGTSQAQDLCDSSGWASYG